MPFELNMDKDFEAIESVVRTLRKSFVAIADNSFKGESHVAIAKEIFDTMEALLISSKDDRALTMLQENRIMEKAFIEWETQLQIMLAFEKK